jgi:lysozyme
LTIKQFITKHEGMEYMPYKCPSGRWTIGIGHNYQDNPLPYDIDNYLREHGKILDDHIDRLLFMDVSRATEDCKSLFPKWDTFSHNRQMALIDFLFQLGKTKASKFKKTIICINAEGWDDAARHLQNSLWYTQVPRRAREVIKLIKEG